VLVVSAALVGSVAAAALASGLATKARFTRYGFSLLYPQSWTQVDHHCAQGLHVMPIAALTTARPAPTCTETVLAGGGMSYPPAVQLGKKGVAVLLALEATLGAKLTWKTHVGGKPANIARPVYGREDAAAVTCPAGVRREYRGVYIRRPGNAMIAIATVICGPNLAAGNAVFRRVLSSIRFSR
jgi:hypothetical protein